MNKKIDESLNLVPFEDIEQTNDLVKEEKSHEPKSSDKSEKERDLEFARGNLYALIEHGSSSLEELKDVAMQSQHPRAYEVLSTMIKTLLDANKDLIDISTVKNPEPVEKEKPVQNNHLYVGSTAELMKLLNKSDDE